MENQDFKVGELVRYKKSFGSRFSNSNLSPEQLGLGIIIEKLSELLVLPHNEIELSYDLEEKYQTTKERKLKVFSDSIKTKICRVYWFKIEKTKWEYEDDLSLAEIEISNN